jgi:sortase (surface protein transpeptidase)
VIARGGDARRPFRRVSLVAAACLLSAMVVAGCASPTAPAPEASPLATASPTPAAPAPSDTSAPTPLAAGVEPVRVSIPAIALDEPLIDLGLNADASMQVPDDFDEVGWFTGGGRPGGRGPVVIAGHVDSPTGPAVFLRLHELQPGDEIEVTDADGSPHRYIVTEAADYPKASFPTARVFGATATDELRLVTCGGIFDRDAASYVDNRVVYAVRAD